MPGTGQVHQMMDAMPLVAEANPSATNFLPLPERTTFDVHHRDHAVVYRGLAGNWPAVRQWSLAYLAEMAPAMPVKLVAGNREREDTRFVASTLRQYLESLQGRGELAGQTLYLKEFDLLHAIKQLNQDVPYHELFPRGSTTSVQSWIGPPNARTGLHHDYLDNRAVQLVGAKRFYLVRPGVVERLGAVSKKYDAWAVLANASAEELAARVRHTDSTTHDFFVVDLKPGDVLHVPALWWHEVVNLTASVSLGGFYGAKAPVLARWAWVGLREHGHRLGWIGKDNCTCHGQQQA